MNQYDPEEFAKQKRLIMIYLIISLIIQIVVLSLYYFSEKQTTLAFPMILGIFITVASMVALNKLGSP